MAKWSAIRNRLLEDPEVRKEYAALPSVSIASQIVNARVSKGLTQVELAKIVGTSQSAIARLERGNYAGHSLKTLLKVAEALDTILDVRFRPKSKAS